MVPHSSTIAWKIPWMEEPGGLQSMGLLRVGHDFTFTFHFHALEKEMAAHSRILAWRIPGTGEPGGLPSMGSHRVRQNWSDLAAAVAVETEEDHSSGNFAYGIKWWWRLGTSEAWMYQSITASLILALAKMYFLRSYSQDLHFNIHWWFWC